MGETNELFERSFAKIVYYFELFKKNEKERKKILFESYHFLGEEIKYAIN